MAENSNFGMAYLTAIKGLAAGTAEPEKNQLPQQDAEGSQRFSGAEKRRSRRYQCEGSIELREEACDVRTWAAFTDISLHGCYVEAQATYPVGALLHMKLDAHNIRIETDGKVRVSYPYLGMGISFTDMSAQNTAELRRLLAMVSRSSLIMGPGLVSSMPAGSREAVPLITDAVGAIQALVEFFENRQTLMREEFLNILRKSQSKA
jgi:hypothetical protein